MSNILPDIQQKIQSQILPLVKPKWQPMMSLGINALSLTPFQSLNTNARLSRSNQQASLMQMYRLMRQPDLNQVFAYILISLFAINEDSTIALDFTLEGDWAILCLGIQPGAGRAIPVWVDVLKYPVSSGSQNLFILDTLTEFKAVVGSSFKLMCDRGFIGETLIHGFLDLDLRFYVRLKSGMSWIVDDKKRQLKRQWKLDQTGIIYQETLRIVRSSKTLQHQLKAKEPWYILTNDTKTNREEIIKTYYHRFEIEETFRDLKHLLSFSKSFIKRRQTIKTILWFKILGFWLTWQVSRKPEIYRQIVEQSVKKKLSWFKLVFEIIAKETKRFIFPEQTYAKVVIQP